MVFSGGQRSCASAQIFGRAGARPYSQKLPKRQMNSALRKKFVINHWLKPVAWQF